MPLNFPVARDVPLKRAPLREVICQVKFDRVLRIVREQPVDLQESIRKHFPVLEVERPLEITSEDARVAGSVDLRPPVYRFRDANRTKMLSLAPDFYALSYSAYEHWGEFADALGFMNDVIQQLYTIPYATRIGLRYVNLIGAEFAESGDFEGVLELLRPELTSMFTSNVILPPFTSVTQIRTDDSGDKFTFRYGIVQEQNSNEIGFLLDFDRYSEGQMDLAGLLPRCERYHQSIYNAFRWCIPESKLAAFAPVAEEAKNG